jgi:hypothetical protein
MVWDSSLEYSGEASPRILEFFGGILLILGFFTAPVAFLLAGQFVVIIFWKLSKNMPLVGGWEFDLLILAGLLVLLSLGAGPYAHSTGCSIGVFEAGTTFRFYETFFEILPGTLAWLTLVLDRPFFVARYPYGFPFSSSFLIFIGC